MESIYIKLKNFVADDKLKEAIQELKELATENGIINTIILLSGRYRELEIAITRNILEWDKIKIEKSQIRLAVLGLIDDLEAQESGDQEFIFNKENKKINFKQRSYSETIALESIENPELKSEINKDDFRLESLVLKFLSQFDRWYFSPLRIQKFGGRQRGFEDLKRYSSKEITKVLLKLLKEKKIKTTRSKKGNPIYKIK